MCGVRGIVVSLEFKSLICMMFGPSVNVIFPFRPWLQSFYVNLMLLEWMPFFVGCLQFLVCIPKFGYSLGEKKKTSQIYIHCTK